jgi:hypothetical protein
MYLTIMRQYSFLLQSEFVANVYQRSTDSVLVYCHSELLNTRFRRLLDKAAQVSFDTSE